MTEKRKGEGEIASSASPEAEISPVKKTFDQWVSEISSAWYRHVDGILEAGDLIVRAEKPAAGLSGAERRELPRKLPFSPAVYSKLKSVAIKFSDESIEREQLPPLYSALYELSHLPLEAITAAIKSREIHPSMSRLDATRLREANGRGAKHQKGKRPIGAARGKASVRVTSGDRKEEDAASEDERVATIFARATLTTPAIAEILTLLEQIEKVQGVSRVLHGPALMGD